MITVTIITILKLVSVNQKMTIMITKIIVTRITTKTTTITMAITTAITTIIIITITTMITIIKQAKQIVNPKQKTAQIITILILIQCPIQTHRRWKAI